MKAEKVEDARTPPGPGSTTEAAAEVYVVLASAPGGPACAVHATRQAAEAQVRNWRDGHGYTAVRIYLAHLMRAKEGE
jgi:hypothetical protein